MKHICEEQLALYAWGDLPFQESSIVVAHLQDCGQCRKALSDFKEARSFVTASLQNPEASELSEVRARLTAELQPQQVKASSWAWWPAGVAAALALVTLPHILEHRPVVTQKIEPLVLTANISPGPTLRIPLTPIATSRHKHVRSQTGIRTVTLISQADRAPVIKMTTADPNVIILWQPNGESK